MESQQLRIIQFKERLKGHEDTILFIIINEFKQLISISYDMNLRVWDLINREIIKKIFLEKIDYKETKQSDNAKNEFSDDEVFNQITEKFLTTTIKNKKIQNYQIQCICKDSQNLNSFYIGFSNGIVARYFLDSNYNQNSEVINCELSSIKQINKMFDDLVYSTQEGLIIIRNCKNNQFKVFNCFKEVSLIQLNSLNANPDQFQVEIICVQNRINVLIINPNIQDTPVLLEQEIKNQIVSLYYYEDKIYLGTIDKQLLIYKVNRNTQDLQITLENTISNLEGWVNKIIIINSASYFSNSQYPYVRNFKQLLILAIEKKIVVFQNNDYQILENFMGHKDQIVDILYDDQKNLLYSSGYDKLIIVWDLKEITQKIINNYAMYREDVQSRQNLVYQQTLNSKKKGKTKKKK